MMWLNQADSTQGWACFMAASCEREHGPPVYLPQVGGMQANLKLSPVLQTKLDLETPVSHTALTFSGFLGLIILMKE
jgi:hypothetical protein